MKKMTVLLSVFVMASSFQLATVTAAEQSQSTEHKKFAKLTKTKDAHFVPVEGEHYIDLGLPASKQPSVVEYYSTFCPHCRHFEERLAEIKSNMSSDIKFHKRHVTFMGGEMGILMAKAHAAAEYLNVQDVMIPVFFRQVQDYRKPPKDVDDVRKLFVQNGISEKQFDGIFSSMFVQMEPAKFDKAFKSTQLRGVPGMIVNDRYQLNLGTLDSVEHINQAIEYLAHKK